MTPLTPAQRRDLRARAHHLDPVVSIAGNGLTPAVMKEIDRCLKAHELIKIRVYGDDRELRSTWLAEICSTLDCAAVQSIGKLLVVFRPKPAEEKPAVRAPRPKVPRAPRPESGRTARTTRGTSAVRRLGPAAAKPGRKPASGPRRAG